MRPLGHSKKELIFMLMIIPPFAVWISYAMFGMRYFSSLYVFIGATLPILALLMVVYILCGMVAAIFLIRFPKYRNTFRRIGFSLIAYILITITGLTLLFWGYDYAGYLDYTISVRDYLLVMAVGIF